MRIVIFASLTKDTTANYIISAFKRNGNSVFTISDINNPLADYIIKGSLDVAELCKELALEPDFFLFIEGGSMLIFPYGVENLSCLTAWYGIDTHMDYQKHLAVSKIFDVSFIAQYQFVAKLLAEGAKQVYWLPLGFEPQMQPSENKERELLISYVGSNNIEKHKERHFLIEAITKRYQKVFFGRATPDEMSKIYAKSLMVFNKSINNDVNMRYFEAMGVGAVLLTDKIENNGVEKLFVDGTHFVTYNNKEHLLDIIENLSKNKEKLNQIGQAAQLLIYEFHTYDVRVKNILESIKLSSKEANPIPFNYFNVFLSFGLISEVIFFFLKILSSSRTGKFNRIVLAVIKPIMYLAFVLAKILEYFRWKWSKY